MLNGGKTIIFAGGVPTVSCSDTLPVDPHILNFSKLSLWTNFCQLMLPKSSFKVNVQIFMTTTVSSYWYFEGFPKYAWCHAYRGYRTFYLFSRYPLETTKVWNLLKLLTPISWIWTISSILTVVVCFQIFTMAGVRLGCGTKNQDITLVPFRTYI